MEFTEPMTAASLPGSPAELGEHPAPSFDRPGPDAVIPSAQLLQGRKTVQIEHNGAFYQLRTTRLGKLILTK